MQSAINLVAIVRLRDSAGDGLRQYIAWWVSIGKSPDVPGEEIAGAKSDLRCVSTAVY